MRLATGYFTGHAARMNYPAFLARRLPIGSGAVESACKAVVQQRQVQAGMRWSHAGAQQLASLRTLHRSGRWDAFRAARPRPRHRLLPAPAPDHAAPAQLPDAAPAPARAIRLLTTFSLVDRPIQPSGAPLLTSGLARTQIVR